MVEDSGKRLILNVGGTRFETTSRTIQRSTYLAGLFDTDEWGNGSPDEGREFFLDR